MNAVVFCRRATARDRRFGSRVAEHALVAALLSPGTPRRAGGLGRLHPPCAIEHAPAGAERAVDTTGAKAAVERFLDAPVTLSFQETKVQTYPMHGPRLSSGG